MLSRLSWVGLPGEDGASVRTIDPPQPSMPTAAGLGGSFNRTDGDATWKITCARLPNGCRRWQPLASVGAHGLRKSPYFAGFFDRRQPAATVLEPIRFPLALPLRPFFRPFLASWDGFRVNSGLRLSNLKLSWAICSSHKVSCE